MTEPAPLLREQTTRYRSFDLPRQAALTLSITIAASLLAAAVMTSLTQTGALPVAATATIWVALASLIVFGLSRQASEHFGIANMVTTARAGMTVLLAGFVPVAHLLGDSSMLVLTAIALSALALDGVDGYLARRRNECSDFGARYDMEIDALLALVISLLLWRSGEAGAWVLGLGLMRYLFIAAGWKLPALQAPLFPSFRRKLICVVQIAALCVMLSALLDGTWSSIVGVAALVLVIGSFARDAHWLLSR